MYLGKVIGTVVCERKYEGLEGRRLLIVQPLDHRREPSGPPEVAVDTVSASPGTLVYLVGSREAALAVSATQPPPVDSAIVGLVDSVDLVGGR
ncbi:MAG TPA: EutN/CcmL family microcompartment protein [Myxococcaceae bacterium]|jgi:ethanolamine utilization protein EutN